MHNLNTKLNTRLSKDYAQEINISGVDSVYSLAFMLNFTAAAETKPNLIIVSNDAEADLLKQALLFYDSTCNISYLTNFQSQMYSEVIPSNRLITDRISWVYSAQNYSPHQKHFFIATMPALLQRTIPIEEFFDRCFELSTGNELPKDITQRLIRMGYNNVPLVEDVGSFAMRGGILDIFSPAHTQPIRLELFGDIIDSIKAFNIENQRSASQVSVATILPSKESLYSDENRQDIARYLKASAKDRNIHDIEIKDYLQEITHWKYFHGSDYFINSFYKSSTLPLDYFTNSPIIWSFNSQSQIRNYDKFIADLKEHHKYSADHSAILPDYNEIFIPLKKWSPKKDSIRINLSQVHFSEINNVNSSDENIEYQCNSLEEFKKNCVSLKNNDIPEFKKFLSAKLHDWKEKDHTVFITSNSENNISQLQLFLENSDFSFNQHEVLTNECLYSEIDEQLKQPKKIALIKNEIPTSTYLKDDRIIFIKLSEIFGKKKLNNKNQKKSDFKKAKALHFADLKIGDYIVHREHGLGLYKGLTLMPISGIDSEFLKLEYKGGDKLYLPIYRIGQIQKFTGAGKDRLIDKLGGQTWQKAKTKVKNKLKDIASELLKLYALRSEITRPPFPAPDKDFQKFVNFFPFTETSDQLNAINHVINDMTLEKPMDRLICGDVGFGKTEVAMRAAFNSVLDGRQVAIIAPTTILTFQHFENFKKRFQHWPFNICCLNRFISASQIKKNIQDIKAGKMNIVIGTHRLFSKDVEFNNLGLLVIDEEQKFGVKHKEKIRSIKAHVDTLTLSATPIPRTLNMSFLGLRDLSLINTPPVDRLPTRTFICKYEKHTIKKAIQNEVDRGGQVFFLHNRVNNIETVAHELRELLPNVKFAIGHGQMKESELEKVMIQFFKKEVDVLISTTIIESGMDIPNANTIIINNAQNLGLSQLYQLRGRVGRSSKRAYCYLMIPQNKLLDKQALERLKVIQQNSNLGSGITIAQYDLELRGSGDLLGENQSGHVNTVGYELYMDLLKEAINEQKENPEIINSLEPEINLRIPALIPDKYISDIRLRLSYYKSLSDIESVDEIDNLEEELRDQFGKLPTEVLNLLGIMLIRFLCKKLYIKDLSQSKNGILLTFTLDTPLSTEQVLKLSSRADNKYSLTPESRLLVKMKEKSWERVYEEISYLAKTANII